MAASSLTFVLGKAAPPGVAGRASPNAPSVWLPLAFTAVGVLSLCFGVGWLLAMPTLLSTYHYNQEAVAVTHLFVLGWICSIVMGSMYQLVPVALEAPLFSERLARWQFGFHVVGFAGMVWMFGVWNLKQVGHYGSVLAVGVGLFVFNLVRTLLRAPKWSVTASAISTMLVWILLTVLAGLVLATGKCTYESVAAGSVVSSVLGGLRAVAGGVQRFDPISAMHAHAHLGAVGCFTILIAGVSYKLIPMFTLSEVQSAARAGWSIALLNLGLIGSFAAILFRSFWKPAGAFVVVSGLALYGFELAAILRARKRRSLDWGIKYFLSGLACLGPVSVLAVVLSWPSLTLTPWTGQLENAYGFLGLMGVVTFAMIGMLYKIIPFLVWFGRYSSQIGRAQVPALADLYSARGQAAGFWTYWLGLILTFLGILNASAGGVRLGLTFLSLSLACLVLNIGKMLSHFFYPKLKPFVLPNRVSALRTA